jgi:hypothetical protein
MKGKLFHHYRYKQKKNHYHYLALPSSVKQMADSCTSTYNLPSVETNGKYYKE